MRRCALVLFFVLMTSPLAAEPIIERHVIGPWPVVSRLIGYQDRIWFANSVKGVNHNSADLHSVAIQGGSPRYEGHLFSQDAGHPVVHRGLLYWPLEDARTEPGIGAFDVTDGIRWEHGLVPTEQAFHNHAMVESGDRLYAAPSAWKGSVARSEDGGATWRTVYLHPTPDRRVSRITRLVAMGDGVYGTLKAPEGRRLIRVDDGTGDPVRGWPSGRSHGLTVHEDRLFGIVNGPEAASLWSWDGEQAKPVWTPPDGWTPRALSSDGEQLWMAGDGADGASLWSSSDGRAWSEIAMLEGGSPRDLVVHRSLVAVGGRGANDHGVLWVLRPSPNVEPVASSPPPDWPSRQGEAMVTFDWARAATHLDRLLADRTSYASFAETLEQFIYDLPRRDVPPDFYPDRLQSFMPSDPLRLFGGIVLDEMVMMARWRLYWGMGLARSGTVDPADILRPADYTPNGPFKFFSTSEIAMWAAGQLGARDPSVLHALVQRLEEETTPLWLKGDAVGALFSVTGQRFGYHAKAWRGWLERN